MYHIAYVWAERSFALWESVLAGVMAASMHYCCFGGDKGSRKAGAVGIVAGYMGYFFVCKQHSGAMDSHYALQWFFNQRGWMLLIAIATYIACWFMAAKLAKNSKSAIWFCLTAVGVVGLSYLLTGVYFGVRISLEAGMDFFEYFSGYWKHIQWQRVLGLCVAMLLTEFLLYRVRAWLAVKPRRLFWGLYLVIVVGVLLVMFRSMDAGLLSRGIY